MILEYSLDEMLGRANGLTTEEFSFFSCRGVSIERVSLGIVPGKKKDQASDLQVALKLFNNSGKDKRVTIDLELMNREVRVSGLLKKLNVGQGDPSSLTITLPFPLKRGEAGVEPKLRVTLELVDY